MFNWLTLEGGQGHVFMSIKIWLNHMVSIIF